MNDLHPPTVTVPIMQITCGKCGTLMGDHDYYYNGRYYCQSCAIGNPLAKVPDRPNKRQQMAALRQDIKDAERAMTKEAQVEHLTAAVKKLADIEEARNLGS